MRLNTYYNININSLRTLAERYSFSPKKKIYNNNKNNIERIEIWLNTQLVNLLYYDTLSVIIHKILILIFQKSHCHKMTNFQTPRACRVYCSEVSTTVRHSAESRAIPSQRTTLRRRSRALQLSDIPPSEHLRRGARDLGPKNYPQVAKANRNRVPPVD